MRVRPLAGRYWRFPVQQCFVPPIRRRRARASCALAGDLRALFPNYGPVLRVIGAAAASFEPSARRSALLPAEHVLEAHCAAYAGLRVLILA